MLPPKLQQVKNQIEAKSLYLRTDSEKALLLELNVLDDLIGGKSKSSEFGEALESRIQKITSGPGGSCPCCGK